MPVLDQFRIEIFERLRKQTLDCLQIKEINSPELRSRQHRLLAWDATCMPTCSHYVPVFLDLIQHHEESGRISPETTVLIETSTGNAGAASAYVAGKLGYELVLFMPEDMPRARIADAESYLPNKEELILTPSGKYVEGMIRSFKRFLVQHRNGYKGKKIFPLDHSRSQLAVETFTAIADRLLEQVSGRIDYGVLALGNGTTTTGFSRALKKRNNGTRIIGVEPFEAPCIYEKKHGRSKFRERYHCDLRYRPHQLIGTGAWGVHFPNYDLSLIDEVEAIRDREWRQAGEELKTLTGSNYGHTSSACFAVATDLSQGFDNNPGLSFFSIFYDSGRKY